MAFATAFFPHYNGLSIEDVKSCKDNVNIELVNDYVYNLFEFIYKGKHDYNKYILGFLPKCETDIEQKPISGLRIFPMSVYIDEKRAEEMCKELGKIKEIFDKNYNYNEHEIKTIKPTHVPK